MKNLNRIGVHCSVANGLHNAFQEAKRLGINTFQIFTRNQRQWQPPPLKEEVIARFHQEKEKHKEITPIFSHASYLINLASPDPRQWKRSVEALKDEMQRAQQLHLAFVIVHPGAHKGSGEKEGIKTIHRALEEVLQKSFKPLLLIENTAGQGTTLGYRLEQLKAIVAPFPESQVGIALDTCHLFAAGYDFSNEKGWAQLMRTLEKYRLLSRLHAWHLNDSFYPLGSRKDRHAHIGKGYIGKEAFALVLKTFPLLPKVLETPKGEGKDEENLRQLYELL